MKRIFHSYDEHVQNVLSGIKFDLESEDAVKVITDYLIRELGTNFPELTRKDVEKFTREAWEIGQAYETGVKDIAPRINQDALDFFERLNNADYGKLERVSKLSIKEIENNNSAREVKRSHIIFRFSLP
ncbi:hypothetical protein QMM95_17860, partial [Leptospira santarosai]|nr:hypothetical protein [Leptospira santarosai]